MLPNQDSLTYGASIGSVISGPFASGVYDADVISAPHTGVLISTYVPISGTQIAYSVISFVTLVR